MPPDGDVPASDVIVDEGSVSYEAMIELCNEVGADMWITVPHMATDEYVANLAHLIRTGVDRATGEQTTRPLREDLRVGGITGAWGFGLVQSGRRLSSGEALMELSKPMVMVTAGRDTIVSTPAADRLCEETMAACRLVRLPEATHCLYLEDEETQNAVHRALQSLADEVVGRG